MNEIQIKEESEIGDSGFTFTKTYYVTRNQEHHIKCGTSLSQTIFNLINANIGTFIFAIPFAFRLGGYWALYATILVGILGNYTGRNLVHLLYEGNEEDFVKVRFTYADIGEAFLPGYGALMVHVINCIEQFTHCIIMLIMPGTVLAYTFPRFGLSDTVWILLLSTITMPSVFLRKMKQVSWTSLVSVVTVVVICLVVLIYTCMTAKGLFDLHESMLPSINLDVTPVSIGIIISSFSTQAYMPVIEGAMVNPSQYNIAMNISYIFVTIFKIIFGIVLYLVFQDQTEEIVTMSLPFNLLGYVINFAVVLVSRVVFVIPMFAVFDIVENQIIFPKRFQKMFQTEKGFCGTTFLTYNLFLRFTIVLVFISIAAAVPQFSLLMSIVGNTTGTILVFIFPSLFYIKLRWKKISIPSILLNSAIFLTAITSCVLGLRSSLRQLLYVFKEKANY